MRKLALAIVVLLVAGLTFPLAAAKTHDVTADVVAVDLTAKTITVKGEKGDMTASVKDTALEALKKVKAGDKVVLTCEDNEKGEHLAVTAIKPAKA